MFFLPFIISIVFFILYNYATDKADIGENENLNFNASVKQLFDEKEHIHYYDIDEHIQKSIIPCYRHQALYYKISNYQNSEDSCAPAFVMIGFLSALGTVGFIDSGIDAIWAIVISLLINVAMYVLISLLFSCTPIFKKLKLKNYSDVCDVYMSEYHYKYLTEIEESVMFRHSLRKMISGIAMVIFLLNIWSSDIY